MVKSVKTIAEWEKNTGFTIVDVSSIDLDEKITKEEFEELRGRVEVGFVDYKYREKWLADNGHEVTRANLLNADLPPKDLA